MKEAWRVLVHFLCLVNDQQVSVLASSAISGPGQKFDPCPTFQKDLLSSQRRFDLGNVSPQLRTFKKIPHLFKGFGRRFLKMRRVNDPLPEQQHSRKCPPLDQQGLAILPGN